MSARDERLATDAVYVLVRRDDLDNLSAAFAEYDAAPDNERADHHDAIHFAAGTLVDNARVLGQPVTQPDGTNSCQTLPPTGIGHAILWIVGGLIAIGLGAELLIGGRRKS